MVSSGSLLAAAAVSLGLVAGAGASPVRISLKYHESKTPVRHGPLARGPLTRGPLTRGPLTRGPAGAPALGPRPPRVPSRTRPPSGRARGPSPPVGAVRVPRRAHPADARPGRGWRPRALPRCVRRVMPAWLGHARISFWQEWSLSGARLKMRRGDLR